MSGKVKIRYAVLCTKHGSDYRGWKAVFVSAPPNAGKAKSTGCPVCKAEESKGVSS